MNDIKLGELITGPAQRDCVHIAIAPVTAAEDMVRGAHVGLNENGEATCLTAKTIGIVDPFLLHGVVIKKGQRFWLLLYQQTITGMRHLWRHSAFPDENELQLTPPPTSPAVSKSEKWLRNLAENAEGVGLTYKELMDATKEYLETGEDYCFGEDIDYSTDWELFWYHYKNVTGVSGTGQFFRCAC